MEDKRHYTSLNRTGEVSDACMAIINQEIKFALDSLDFDQRGDATERDRALELSEAANAERKELGCP